MAVLNGLMVQPWDDVGTLLERHKEMVLDRPVGHRPAEHVPPDLPCMSALEPEFLARFTGERFCRPLAGLDVSAHR